MRQSVSVTGPPARICWRNSGTTDPLVPSTLPKRTMEKRVWGETWLSACSTSSAARFVAPITLVGRAARAGHHHRSTVNHCLDQIDVGIDRGPSQEIFELQLAYVCDLHPPVSDVHQTRQGADAGVCTACRGDDLVAAHSRCRR